MSMERIILTKAKVISMAASMLKISGSERGLTMVTGDVSQRSFPITHPIYPEVGFMIILIVPMLPIM